MRNRVFTPKSSACLHPTSGNQSAILIDVKTAINNILREGACAPYTREAKARNSSFVKLPRRAVARSSAILSVAIKEYDRLGPAFYNAIRTSIPEMIKRLSCKKLSFQTVT